MNRAEYDALKNSFPPEAQWQFWPPPVHLATWKEMPLILLSWLAGVIVVIVGFLLFMWLLATIIENAGERSTQHDRCLKHATNGYEIERCR